MFSPELADKVDNWRRKAREGTLTKEEMREAIAALRSERGQVSNVSTARKASVAKAKKPSGDDLLSELEGL